MLNDDMNLTLLKRSRKPQQVGDIFVFRPKNRDYYWGLVVSTTAKIGIFEGCALVYLYKIATQGVSPIPEFNANRLLVPPAFINRTPWTRGYFLTVGCKQIHAADLVRHCFKDILRDWYWDENGNRVPYSEPCGTYGLGSYRSVDDEISMALGIPLSAQQ